MRCSGFIAFVWLASCAEPSPIGPDTSTDEDDVTSGIVIERGVDRAGEFSVHEARVLHSLHGVKWSGVYIGGPCDGGFGWTKGGVEAIANATGWRFMPIYVGQQASSLCGAHDLTFAQGEADGRAAARRARDFGWGANRDIPIALDVEAATYFDHVSASTSYVHGWIRAIHTAGYRAYIYASPFALNHYHDVGVGIDAAWAASYFYHGFASVKPGDLDQMGGRFRNHHNRAWQYAGDFSVAGAGQVDADTSNLLLAPKPGGSNRSAVAARRVPESCGALTAGEGLARGESLTACDGSVTLTLGDDGELALTAASGVVWSAGTAGAGVTAVLEDTGELVVFDQDLEPVFTSGTAGFADTTLALRTDSLALVDRDRGGDVWTTARGLLVTEPAEVAEPAGK